MAREGRRGWGPIHNETSCLSFVGSEIKKLGDVGLDCLTQLLHKVVRVNGLRLKSSDYWTQDRHKLMYDGFPFEF